MSVFISKAKKHYVTYYSLSKNTKAFKNYNAVLKLTEKVAEGSALEGKANALSNIGLIYRVRGNFVKALNFFENILYGRLLCSVI